MKKIDVLLGLQWGDEGKGKVVDVLTPDYDVIARFQGGPNAGHSLEFNDVKHVLHLIPSGIFHSEKINIIGNGVVLDPKIFIEEVTALDQFNIEYKKNLHISKKAHLILPTHRLLDKASEIAKGDTKIGSTLKGIGPAYMDKTGRNGLRVGDVLLPNFEEKYNALKEKHKQLLCQYQIDMDIAEFEDGWLEAAHKLKEFILVDSEHDINAYLNVGKSVLAEGAQGTLLDIDFGSYPFVTSSSTISAGACTGLGVAPNTIGDVIGIFKAYCTRVGSGPFPTELFDTTGEKMKKCGNEFGATTGRSRRCGWLDLVALKYAIMINGVTRLVMTKGDVLSGFETIRVCNAYEIDGMKHDKMPYDIAEKPIEPIYKEFKGWEQDISGCRTFSGLPDPFKQYIAYLEKELKVPISVISVGPDRDQTIFHEI